MTNTTPTQVQPDLYHLESDRFETYLRVARELLEALAELLKQCRRWSSDSLCPEGVSDAVRTYRVCLRNATEQHHEALTRGSREAEERSLELLTRDVHREAVRITTHLITIAVVARHLDQLARVRDQIGVDLISISQFDHMAIIPDSFVEGDMSHGAAKEILPDLLVEIMMAESSFTRRAFGCDAERSSCKAVVDSLAGLLHIKEICRRRAENSLRDSFCPLDSAIEEVRAVRKITGDEYFSIEDPVELVKQRRLLGATAWDGTPIFPRQQFNLQYLPIVQELLGSTAKRADLYSGWVAVLHIGLRVKAAAENGGNGETILDLKDALRAASICRECWGEANDAELTKADAIASKAKAIKFGRRTGRGIPRTLYRITQRGHGPWFFGPSAAAEGAREQTENENEWYRARSGRWDLPDCGDTGVAYLGTSLKICWAEVLARCPVVRLSDIVNRVGWSITVCDEGDQLVLANFAKLVDWAWAVDAKRAVSQRMSAKAHERFAGIYYTPRQAAGKGSPAVALYGGRMWGLPPEWRADWDSAEAERRGVPASWSVKRIVPVSEEKGDGLLAYLRERREDGPDKDGRDFDGDIVLKWFPPVDWERLGEATRRARH
jgi:hypothetical protein